MAASITGTVFNDLNHNGVRDIGEPGIPNVFVVLEDTLGNCSSIQTDVNGDYTFSNITIAGDYKIYETVVSPGATCPPDTFQQPSGFNGSTTRRQITLNVTNANINNDDILSDNDFGHDSVEAFGCTSFAWQFAGGELIRIDLATGDFVNLGFTNPSSTNLNGFGYNTADGNLYGYNIVTDRVFRVSRDMILMDLPPIPNLPFNSYFAGDVNMDGYLYIGRGNEATLYVIDVDPNRATYGLLVDPQNSFQEDTPPFGLSISSNFSSADFSFNPQDNFIYAAGGDGIVRRIDPISGVVTSLTTNPIITGTFGGQFFDDYNHLYSIRNSDGTVRQYAISGNNATVVDFSNTIASGANDGGRCATAPIVFADFELNIGKSATPIVGVGDTITYSVVLDNIGNTTANNFVFIDTIPTGTTFVSNSLTYNGVTLPSNPNPPGVLLGDVGVGLNTVTFQVVVDTIPSINPIPNIAYGSYTFVDTLGGETFSGSVTTNIATTTIVEAIIHSSKAVDKDFAKVGDTLTYTIVLNNTGNTTADSIFFIDTIPSGTTFVANSLFQDATPVAGSPSPPGVTLPNSLGEGNFSVVTFEVIVVDTVPTINPIPNNASATFTYTGNPDVPTIKEGNTNTDTVNTRINQANLSSIQKFVDRDFADCGDTLTYTVVLSNTGNTTALNVVVMDTVPNGTMFIPGSVTIDNNNTIFQPSNIVVGNINVNQTVTITFQVIVLC